MSEPTRNAQCTGSAKNGRKPRLTPDQWAAIRIEWEGDPSATFLGLAEKFGVSHSQISRRSVSEGWVKRNQIAAINEAAQRRADAYDETATGPRPATTADLATRDESEAKRAAVLVRHRREWEELEGFRKAALAVMKAAHEGSQEWRNAKQAADTAVANLRALEIKQAGESKAWGLSITQEEEIVIRNPRPAE